MGADFAQPIGCIPALSATQKAPLHLRLVALYKCYMPLPVPLRTVTLHVKTNLGLLQMSIGHFL